MSQKIRVGIPRGLLYYQYYPAWESFFKYLGFEVVLSPETNKGILEDGLSLAVDEICLPFKLYFGHVNKLKDSVDILFVPRFVRVEKRRTVCPKFLGLPDMIRNSIRGLPRIFAPNIDLGKGVRGFFRLVEEAGEGLCISKSRAAVALFKAQYSLRQFEAEVLEKQIYPHQVLEGKGDRDVQAAGTGYSPAEEKERLTVALLGHSYLLYDRFLNLGIIEKLQKLGLRVITPELISREGVRQGIATLNKDLFWTFNTRILGSAIHMLREKLVAGMIQLASFGCGPDSLSGELIERKARRQEIPVMNLNLDEHSGEAGFLTRLEAFTDLLNYRAGAGL